MKTTVKTSIDISTLVPLTQITGTRAVCGSLPVTTELRPIDQLSTLEFEAWHRLEKNSLDGNPYLSPSFVKSVLNWLKPVNPPLVLIVRQGEEWIGCGLFSGVAKSRRLPMPHLKCWSTEYSFLDSMLLHREHAESAANGFWRFMTERKHHWQGVEFPRLPVDSPTADVLARTATNYQISTWNGMSLPRAALIPALGGEEALLSATTVARARSLRKGRNELNKRGPVTFRLVGLHGESDREELREAGQRFLDLEDQGWKRANGTSLRRISGGSQFFEHFVFEAGSHQNIFFSELLVADEVICSVAHIISGDQAFSFKLGWKPEYERGCPGFLIKAGLVQQAPEKLSHLTLIDSCSTWGSFIEHVWPHRRQIGTRIHATTLAARIALKVTRSVSWAKRQILDQSASPLRPREAGELD